MEQFDFSKVVLTDDEIDIFKFFESSNSAFLTKKQYSILHSRGLVTGEIGGKSAWFDDTSDGICKLSDKGKRYRAYLKKENKKIKITTTRYRVTTGIAITALILSIISIIISLMR